MTKTNQSFTMWEGTYCVIPVTVQDGDSAAVNLTGATLTWVMTSPANPAGETLLTKTLGSGIAVVSAAAGTVEITLQEADTANLGGASYYHELVIDDSSGHSEVGFTGRISIKVSKVL